MNPPCQASPPTLQYTLQTNIGIRFLPKMHTEV